MKRRLIIYLVLNAYVSFAQNKAIDSLQQALKDFDAGKLEMSNNLLPDESDTTRVNILNALIRQYLWISDYAAAKSYADDALAIARQIGFKIGMAQSYSSIGSTYWYQGNYTEALDNLFAALKIFEEIGNKNGMARAYGNIGITYGQQGNYSEALKYYFMALRIFGETEYDKNDMATTYTNIGVAYDNQKNYTEAMKYHVTALKLFEEAGNRNGIAMSYNNIAVIHKVQGNYPEALKYSFEALKISEEMGEKQGYAFYKNNIGHIYFLQGNYTDALKYQIAALKIFEEIGDKNGIAWASISIGNSKVKLDAAKEGRDWMVKGLMLAKEIGTLEHIQYGYEGLAAADSALGDFEGAYENHKLLILYRDSLNNAEATKKSLETKMQYDFDTKHLADSLQYAREREVGALKLQRQKAITYTGFAAVFFTSLFLYLMYRSYQKQRLANQRLKEAQEQLIKSEKMAAFGVMATRVSHEIMNPLNFVNNFSELSQGMIHDLITSTNEADRKEYSALLITNLQKILEHGNRAAVIVKQLQEHSLKGSAQEFFES